MTKKKKQPKKNGKWISVIALGVAWELLGGWLARVPGLGVAFLVFLGILLVQDGFRRWGTQRGEALRVFDTPRNTFWAPNSRETIAGKWRDPRLHVAGSVYVTNVSASPVELRSATLLPSQAEGTVVETPEIPAHETRLVHFYFPAVPRPAGEMNQPLHGDVLLVDQAGRKFKVKNVEFQAFNKAWHFGA